MLVIVLRYLSLESSLLGMANDEQQRSSRAATPSTPLTGAAAAPSARRLSTAASASRRMRAMSASVSSLARVISSRAIRCFSRLPAIAAAGLR